MSHLARSIRHCFALAAVTSTASLVAGPALGAAGELEEIIVTAQKQEQKLSETPLSVTALSAKDLNALGATQFRDFANTIPGLSFTSTRRRRDADQPARHHVGRERLPDRRHLRRRGPVRIQHGLCGGRAARAGRGPVRSLPRGGAARTAGHALRGEHDGRPAEVRDHGARPARLRRHGARGSLHDRARWRQLRRGGRREPALRVRQGRGARERLLFARRRLRRQHWPRQGRRQPVRRLWRPGRRPVPADRPAVHPAERLPPEDRRATERTQVGYDYATEKPIDGESRPVEPSCRSRSTRSSR